MTQTLDVEKAIQAVGVLLRREGKRASRLRLLKLLYIADRISLQKTGTPILGSKVVALKHGPVHMPSSISSRESILTSLRGHGTFAT